MTEIEKMEQYIKRTKLDKSRYCLHWPETLELTKRIKAGEDPIEAIALAFNYGKAKGYRQAKAEVRA